LRRYWDWPGGAGIALTFQENHHAQTDIPSSAPPPIDQRFASDKYRLGEITSYRVSRTQSNWLCLIVRTDSASLTFFQ
jgi:hypothetical protein